MAGRQALDAGRTAFLVGAGDDLGLDADGDDGGLHPVDHVGEGRQLGLLHAGELDRLRDGGTVAVEDSVGETGHQADAERRGAGDDRATLQDRAGGSRRAECGFGSLVVLRHGSHLDAGGRAFLLREEDHGGRRLTRISPDDDSFVRLAELAGETRLTLGLARCSLRQMRAKRAG